MPPEVSSTVGVLDQPAGASSGAGLREALQQQWQQTAAWFDVLTDTQPAPVGQTPKDVVWEQGTATLYHYCRQTAKVYPIPLVMVHSLISKPYILDLIPGNSFIEYLVRAGFDVYLVDWGTPRPEDRHLRLEDYVLDLLPACLDRALEISKADEFSLFGYCMGGLLALLYAATHPAAPLRNLVTLATPVDLQQTGLMAFWAQPGHMDVDRLVDSWGNIPPWLIQQSFRMLRPASELSPVRYISLWQHALEPAYVAQYRAFDRWTQDHIPFPGECFRQTTKELVWKNKLVRGELELRGQAVSLEALRCAVLAVVAEADHIAPLASTRPLLPLLGSTDKEFVVMPGGHVGLAAGRKAVQTLWPRVAVWLGERSQRPPRQPGLRRPRSERGHGRPVASRITAGGTVAPQVAVVTA